ncbi:hypothetical protein Tco_0492561 [Tanacetum coccineum]
MAIEESKDLSTLPRDELIGNLKVYEVVLEKDSKISKSKKEKYKSLALKVRKVSSDEEVSCSDSDDEEYATTVRDFKKFFRRRGKLVRKPHDDKKNFRKIKKDKKEKNDQRCFKCGDPNHFISDYPKHSFNDQKAFVVGCWSDSEEDSKKDEICLMALDNNENTLVQKVDLVTHGQSGTVDTAYQTSWIRRIRPIGYGELGYSGMAYWLVGYDILALWVWCFVYLGYSVSSFLGSHESAVSDFNVSLKTIAGNLVSTDLRS